MHLIDIVTSNITETYHVDLESCNSAFFIKEKNIMILGSGLVNEL